MTAEMGRAPTTKLALGIAAEEERDAALPRMSGCVGCRQLVAELSLVGDELLLLAPAQEPPLGFESSVLGALAGCQDVEGSSRSGGAGGGWRQPPPWSSRSGEGDLRARRVQRLPRPAFRSASATSRVGPGGGAVNGGSRPPAPGSPRVLREQLAVPP
jgi:hypothetical protein